MISEERLREIAQVHLWRGEYSLAVDAFVRAVEREALEEAARACEQQPYSYSGMMHAAAIRALMDNEGVQPEDCTCVGFHTNCSKENQNV